MANYETNDPRVLLVGLIEHEMPVVTAEFMKIVGCKKLLKYGDNHGIQQLLPGLWSLSESDLLGFLRATGLNKNMWRKCASALITVLTTKIRPLIAERYADDPGLMNRCLDTLDREIARSMEMIAGALCTEYAKEMKEARDELQGSLEEIRAMNEELRTANEEIQTAFEEVECLKNRLEKMMKYASDAVFIVDASSYQILEANMQAAALLGYPIDEITRNSAVKFFPSYLLPQLMERLERLRMEGHMVFEDIPMIARDLKDIPVEISAVQIKLDNDDLFYLSARNITERKEAEKALVRAKKDWEDTFNAMTDMVMSLDTDFRIIKVNKATANALKMSQEKIVGQKCYKVLHGRREPIADCPVVISKKQMVPCSREITEPRIGGTFICTISPCFNHDGNLTGYTHLLTNITDRKKAEDELAEQRRILQIILDHIPDLVVLKNKDSVYEMVNPAFCAYVGRSAEEIIGCTDYDLFPPAEADKYKIDDTRIMANDTPYMGEELVTSVNARRHWLYVSKTPVKDTAGQVSGILCAVRNITKLKESEAALERARAELDQIFQTAVDGMRVVDMDFNITRVNNTFADMIGLNQEEIVGKKCYEIIDAEMCHTPECPLTRIMNGEKDIECSEQTIRLPKKEDVRCIVTSKPFKGAKGDLIGIIEDFNDVTERQKLEAQLRQTQKMDSIGTLAGGLAHDFNNLLGGILGYTSIIKTNLGHEDRNYKYLELMERAGERAAELTNQLLAFSRKGKYLLKPVDLNKSIRNVISLLERTINKNIRIQLFLSEDIATVEGDPGQMEQVVMNLCVNAVDAMPEAGDLELTTGMVDKPTKTEPASGMQPGQDVLLLQVKDTGVGMDEETTARIFEPFFTTKGIGKGTGLGMSMVYGIVKNHGGHIEVESTPGKGTLFKIYLPAIHGSAGAEPETDEKNSVLIPKGTGTILVVDDEEIIRDMMQDMLESMGYKAMLAANGKEAISLFKKYGKSIQLVLVDMIMPGLNGKDTCYQLRELDPNVKLILASGYSRDSLMQDLVKQGISDFIHKPFSMQDLSKKIQEQIGSFS